MGITDGVMHLMQPVDARAWQKCPVCFGKGMVPNGFYLTPGREQWSGTSTAAEPCRSCGGRGIVR